ncbi:P-type ATPase-like protein [Pleomassaria siparia CBS 279.74]|uniref:Cation-transporting ATPase n=1 Tax=Pleomassaria siparia CBS 279.74 TaxID=1314801 RepID=A0A6G1KQ98_9PLEO|nr:P-type ATPase-like protein [Pleomassaria siparia CBS 279.74]
MNNQNGSPERRRKSGMYRRGSNMSDLSFMTDVEMAHDEVFAGPMSESVPTSISSFAHRRARADSTTSFTYYDEDRDSEEGIEEEAIAEEYGEIEYDEDYVDQIDDLEAGVSPSPPQFRRKSSVHSSRRSVDRPLLRRYSIASSAGSGDGGKGWRTNQKIYILTEDLTIVVAGFKTSSVGFSLYVLLCTCTAGLAWLLFRWLPRWRVALTGRATPINDCDWVVVENQWGELAVQSVSQESYGRSLSTVFGDLEKRSNGDYDEDSDPVIKQLRCLDYRYIRFCYHPLKDKFVLANTWKDPAWTNTSALREGLDNEERDYRELVFGRNVIDIEEKTVGQLLVDEAFHPFYVFQIASLFLWSVDEYYYYAACIFIISLVSIITTLIETKATMKRLREVSRFECDVRVLRNGFWRHVESGELVPGDVYEVTDPSLTLIPCDSLLLSGDCIVNESMLTGESVPVSKVPVTDEALDILDLSASSIHPEVARHMLFSGTKIIRARRPHDDGDDEAAALAMVIRTGFNTTKGALVRSMLFPKPSGFKFYQDSFRYIAVMGLIAMVGFVASFINFINFGLAWHLILVRALDLITIVVPPALPATLTIGTNFALSRLKQKQIFCISPQRVNVGGKLDVVCFDKTGTLTEEGLDVLGVRVVQRPDNRFSDLLADPMDVLPGSTYERDPTVEYSHHKAILYTMATCHSLRLIDDELVGDPLDVKMFNFTGWSYEEGEQGFNGGNEDEQKLSPSVARPPPGREFDIDDREEDINRTPVELGVLKTFEFVSQLRRASVIVRRFGSRAGFVYVKGAPECMKTICRPESFPADYEDLLAYYTHRGFRVIACAAKTIKVNWLKIQKMKREEAESDMDFVGFIIFENKLKPTTTAVIEELERANIRNVMCTGDNILTAISVARECTLINRTAHCFVPRFVEGDSRTALAKLSWESVDDPLFKLDENTLKPLPPPVESDASLPYDISNLRNYSLAVSGDVFRWIIDFASEKVLREMLVCGQVFARMSPDEKHELVEKLQSIDYCCGFCGDGANDCGALKAADVGISLSEAEASVAAPFTSRVFDISCVPQVIKEGRAALVTSFSCFKYMSLYSAIQFTSVSFLYASASNLGDFQFLFIDLLLILPIAIFMGWSGAYPYLSRKRPTASLVSRKVLTPLIGQIVICVIVQLIGFEYVQKQTWYQPPVLDKNHSNPLNSQNTTLFLVSCFQYILSAVVLSIGRPFREPMSQNLPFVITMAITLAITCYMLFDPAQWLTKLMQLTYLDTGFKLFILVLGFGNFAMAYVSEKYLLTALARWIGIWKVKMNPKWSKKRKAYKEIIESMKM